MSQVFSKYCREAVADTQEEQWATGLRDAILRPGSYNHMHPTSSSRA
jgi:hypothetical protein